MVSLKRLHFSAYHYVCFPTVVRKLVGSLDSSSCFLAHSKKYMTPTHALIFQKHVKMCTYTRVCIRTLKSQCKLITLWGSTCSKKKVGWEVIFSEHGFTGSRARKPRREFEGSTLEPFFLVILRLNGLQWCS